MVREDLIGTIEAKRPNDANDPTAILHIQRGEVHVGDTIHIRGTGIDAETRIARIEHHRRSVEAGHKGEDVLLELDRHLAQPAQVYKVDAEPYRVRHGRPLKWLFDQ